MENADLIYEMAKRLDMVIQVHKKGEYQGTYKFINGKLHKLKDKKPEQNVAQGSSSSDNN